MANSKETGQGDAERSMSDLRTVRRAAGSTAGREEVSIGDLRTAQTKPRRSSSVESAGDIIAGKYKITSRLGHGGMGVVHLAVDQKLGREVTIKRLLTGEDSANRGIDLFLQEARAIAALNHRNIVTIFELGEDDHGPFIVMEYLSGGDLRKAIHTAGKMDMVKSLAIFNALAQGLAYAHSKGIIHRDIKPGNVLLDEDGTPKLVDFGLAQMGQESDLMVTGQGMGTMAYMAPEQLRDAKHVDVRSDIYALAKTLYHMLTGEVPTTVDLEMVPAEVRAAMRQALKNKPEERPPSVVDFVKLFAESVSTSAGAASAPTDRGVFKPDKCVSCGHQNPEKARFCEGCGAGLFEPCPKCKVENRAGTKHCSKCGIKILDYKAADEACRQAQEFLKDHKPQQAVEAAKRGLATGFYQAELRACLQQADAIDRQVQKFQTAAEQLVEQGAFEQAIEKLDESLKLDPHRQAIVQLREQLLRRMGRRDEQGHLEAARRSLQERRFEVVIQSCQAIQKLDPLHAEAAALLAQAEPLQKDYQQRLEAAQRMKNAFKHQEAADLSRSLAADFPWDEKSRALLSESEATTRKVETLRQEARQAIEQKRFEKAIQACVALRQLMPHHPEIASVLPRANALKKDHQDRVERVKQFRKGFRYADAIALLVVLEADYPWDDRLKKARLDFESALKRIETLLHLATEDLEKKKFDAVLQTCTSLRQLKPDLPEAAALKEQAEAMKDDHGRRSTEAIELKTAYSFAEAAESLRKLTADYPWDKTAQDELQACEMAIAELEERTGKAQGALKAGQLLAARTAWQGVLALNPQHSEARRQVADIKSKLATRQLRLRIAIGVAALIAIATIVTLFLFHSDRQHLAEARAQLSAGKFDAARQEVAKCAFFGTVEKSAILNDADRAEADSLVQQAAGEVQADQWKHAADMFTHAEAFARDKGLQVTSDSQAKFAAALMASAVRLANRGRVGDTVDCYKQAVAFATARSLPTTQPIAIADALDKQSDKAIAGGQFDLAQKSLEAAGTVLGDPSHRKDQILHVRDLVSQSGPARTAKQAAEAAAGNAKAATADQAASKLWAAAEGAYKQAQVALERQQFVDAQSGFTTATQQYEQARVRAVGIASAGAAKAAFDSSIKKYDADQLTKFGGDVWAKIGSLRSQADAAKDDFAATVAAYKEAATLLPEADRAAKAGALGARKAELLATAKANDNPQNGKTALAALSEMRKIDPQDAEGKALQKKIEAYYIAAIRDEPAGAKADGQHAVSPVETWISKNATYKLSSNNPYHQPLTAFLTGDENLHVDKFAFHTAEDVAGGYAVIDLGEVRTISKIWIENRREPVFHARARGLSVWLSISADNSGDKVWSAPKPASEWEFTVPKVKARFVTIGLPNDSTQPLHLAHAKIFATAQLDDTPNQRPHKMLLISNDDGGGTETAAAACRKYGLQYDLVKTFDRDKRDYNAYGTIVAGSAAMDYWENARDEEAFIHVDDFIKGGGHLVVFGTWNGRNLEHLRRYEITTGSCHSWFFDPVPGVTDALFAGNEDLIPTDRRMRSVGNLKCSVEHTVLLRRRVDEQFDAGSPNAQFRGEPAMLTRAVGKGRLTITLVEPHWAEGPQSPKSLWLLTATISWVSRGCPTEKISDRPQVGTDARGEAAARELILDLGDKVAMKLVRIPAGKFLMGSAMAEKGRQDNEVPHEVTISQPFYFGVYEVTADQYAQFVKDTGHQHDKPNFKQTGDHPVVNVSWEDAQSFCKWLSKKTGKRVVLPTEAQWEYTCRAGMTTGFSFGDNDEDLCKYGNYCDRSNTNGLEWQDKRHSDGFDKTAPVGSLKSNDVGLYDMHGNVWEWCSDWYAENYVTTDSTDPVGPASGSLRATRGGSWHGDPQLCRSARRGKDAPSYRSIDHGFRVVVIAAGRD